MRKHFFCYTLADMQVGQLGSIGRWVRRCSVLRCGGVTGTAGRSGGPSGGGKGGGEGGAAAAGSSDEPRGAPPDPSAPVPWSAPGTVEPQPATSRRPTLCGRTLTTRGITCSDASGSSQYRPHPVGGSCRLEHEARPGLRQMPRAGRKPMAVWHVLRCVTQLWHGARTQCPGHRRITAAPMPHTHTHMAPTRGGRHAPRDSSLCAHGS